MKRGLYLTLLNG